MAIKDYLLEQGPRLAMMAMAAKQGGPQAMAAFMEGVQRKQMLEQQTARQGMQDQRQADADARSQELHQAQLGNYERDNQRADTSLRQQQFARALQLIQAAQAQQVELATDPLRADAAMQSQIGAASSAFGVPQEQLTPFVQPMAPLISARKKKQAQTLYERAEKRYNPKGENPEWESSITLQTGEQFGDVTPAQLREMFEAPAVDATGAPALPYVKPSTAGDGASDLDRSFQREKAAREADLGRPLTPKELADLDREIRREVRAITQPASASAEPLVQVTDTDPNTGEVVTSLVPRKPGEVSRKPPAEPNQSQFTAAGYAGRMEQAEPILAAVSPAITSMSLASFELQTNSWFAKPTFQSKDVQSYMQAARNFINAVLRRESGAVISPTEFAEAKAQYLPMPGEDEAALAQKAANRQYVFNSMKRAGGRAYEPPLKPPTAGAAPNMGERRMFNGQLGEWDGKGWKPVQ